MAEIKEAKISDLVFDDKNFNKHTEYGMSLIEKSIRNNGAGRSILIDKNNRIIAGNGVVETAAQIGIDDVQIVETDGKKIIAVKRTDIDLDSKQGREMALADNATGAADLQWDAEAIAEVEEEFDIDAGDWGVNLDFDTEQPTATTDATEDDFDESTDAIETKCKKGEVWLLGEHRLMCGDSTSVDDVAKLMDGAKADMVFTDPPYGVSYVRHIPQKERRFEMLKNDDAVLDFFPNINNFSKGFVFICSSWKALDKWLPLFKKYLELSNIIIWSKGGGSMGDLKTTFAVDYEIILCSSRKNNILGKRIGCVWECRKDCGTSYDHPTQKPVGLSAIAIEHTTHQNDLVLDLFGGSGSTLIACEQLNRKCYMMELSPHYCDVIIARWEKLTNQKARRITDG